MCFLKVNLKTFIKKSKKKNSKHGSRIRRTRRSKRAPSSPHLPRVRGLANGMRRIGVLRPRFCSRNFLLLSLRRRVPHEQHRERQIGTRLDAVLRYLRRVLRVPTCWTVCDDCNFAPASAEDHRPLQHQGRKGIVLRQDDGLFLLLLQSVSNSNRADDARRSERNNVCRSFSELHN